MDNTQEIYALIGQLVVGQLGLQKQIEALTAALAKAQQENEKESDAPGNGT